MSLIYNIFYNTAINKDVKASNDNETIGLLICRSSDKQW
jgi:hypothetical protein